MKKLRIKESALEDIDEIYRYVVKDGQSIAENQIAKIKAKILLLRAMPNIGVTIYDDKQKSKYRSLVSNPYIILYEISEESINVVHVVDGRRNLKKFLKGK